MPPRTKPVNERLITLQGHHRILSKPELLAPAGSPEALYAAIEAGADAVYFGASLYSNRMRAKNFEDEELLRAAALCRAYSVSSYITMNTRLRDRELPDALDLACRLYESGVSAFIVADAGFAALLHERLPDAVLHASTQMTGVCADDAAALARLGFSRMVCPRELTHEELSRLVRKSPIEIEMFVHGAHCVSVSGQCLMSWAMGGRSGNRGECAQPCRLPYRLAGHRSALSHPLSLKDMCLASHIPELIRSGVASLKIEGRLKSPDYVYGVTRIYRRLLDEGRCASKDELQELDSIFSRDGFTDGYFRGKHTSMNGMRPEGSAVSSVKFSGLTRKIPIKAHMRIHEGEAATLTLTCAGGCVSMAGDVVQKAKSAPVSPDIIYKNVAKLGGMPYSLDRQDFSCDSSGDAFMTTAQINSLRRSAVSQLERAVADSAKRMVPVATAPVPKQKKEILHTIRTAEFMRAADIPTSAANFFDVIFLPENEASRAKLCGKAEVGLALPLWCSDGDSLRRRLKAFSESGGRYTLAHSYAEIVLSAEAGLIPIASLRLNVTNTHAAEVMSSMGAEYVILSPELKGAAVRDIASSADVSCGAVVYGKLPLMLTRRCVMADKGCSGACDKDGCHLPSVMADRRGTKLSVLPAGNRMNLIVNPHPVWSADKSELINTFRISHFIFTTESVSEADGVISGYRDGSSPEEVGILQYKRF